MDWAVPLTTRSFILLPLGFVALHRKLLCPAVLYHLYGFFPAEISHSWQLFIERQRWGERSSKEIKYSFKLADLFLRIDSVKSVAPLDIWQVFWFCLRDFGGGNNLGTGVKCSKTKPRGEEIAALRRENICRIAKWHRELLLQAELGLTSLQQCFELPPDCLEIAQDLPPHCRGSAGR